MCGIGGVMMRGRAPADRVLLERLGAAMHARGPDGDGFHVDGPTGLVHKRLSIIDLDGGAQPISSQSGTLNVVVNGEIYNFKALQAEVTARGYPLKTRSDSELILPLYDDAGLDGLRRLEGMFAFALADAGARQVILGRDPFGIKPLYYAQTPQGIAFASVPAALAQCGWIKPARNDDALPGLLHRQYTAGRQTLWQGIERVLPGEVLVLEDGAIKARRRFSPSLTPPSELGEVEALVRLEELLHRSVELHVQSDVPYGAFLSGGIDSSSMVTMMQKVVGKVATYTIGFESDTVSDERGAAEALAQRLGCGQASVSFSEGDFWSLLPDFAMHMDDLVIDYAALPLLKLSQRAREDVKVILSGEGGDEIFAGYGRYRPRLMRRLLGQSFRGRGAANGQRALFARDLPLPLESEAPADLTALQIRQYKDIQDWLPDDLLTKVDRCLMAHSVEGRVPFLDLELAQFAFALPDGLKLRGKNGKWLLKEWLGRNQPIDVWAKKRGFTVPITDWLNGRRALLSDYLDNHEALGDLVRGEALRSLLSGVMSGRDAKLVFHLLALALWQETHIHGRAPDHELFAAQALAPAA